MRHTHCFVLLLTVCLTLTSFARTQAPEPLRTAGDRPVDIRHIRLDLRVDLPKKIAEGKATLDLHTLRPISSIVLDAVEFEVKRVLLKDAEVPFSHDGKQLTIDLESAWPAGREATFQIDYRVREPRAGLHFFGPTPADPDIPLTVWSQGEATTNRYWFPCLDHPAERQSTELVVTVAEGFEVVSNGRLVERKANAADKTVTFHWKQEQPHVSYLVTLVVGKFDVVREEWNKLPVLYYVPKGKSEQVARTFGRTRAMLDFFTRRFGIDYPWEKYAQVVAYQFSGGGMENTSATTLTERVLRDERSILDSSPDGLIAHELAHQWWGDLVTCRDWAHLWLNEGFASFSEALWDEHHLGAEEYAYTLVDKARSAINGGKERPVVDRRYSSPGSMFDARAYPKGAWVLHMLRQRLGEEAFWKAVQRFGREHRYQSVETATFRHTLEADTGRNLERFFYDWTERPGHPVLEIASEYLPETKQVRLVVKQTQASEAFHLPLTIAFHGPWSSKPLVVDQELTEKQHTFFVPLPARPTLIDVDPRMAILGEIKETKGRELWVSQLRQAQGVAARVRAAQYLGQTKSPADREVLAAALLDESQSYWGIRLEIATALGDSGGDAARDALIRGVKDAHARVRRGCVEQLGKFRRDATAAAAIKGLLDRGDPAYSVERAALLAYARLQQPDALAVILPWLARASQHNTLQAGALTALGDTQNLAALDVLLAWTKRGKPREARLAALSALARLAQTANPSEEQRRQIAEAVAACLDGETEPIRRAAVTTLRDLGRSASPALAALEALERHDPDDRVRELARRAIDQARSNAPLPVELTRLREELDRMRKAQEQLQERLGKYEKVDRKGM